MQFMSTLGLGFRSQLLPGCLETSPVHASICLEHDGHLVAAAGHLIRHLGAARPQQLGVVRVQN